MRSGGEAAAGGARYLLDVYCGVGVFALCGRKQFAQCLGVEVNADAVKRAQSNAALNHAANCAFIAGTAAAIFAQAKFPPKETAVILDPPRAGATKVFCGSCSITARRASSMSPATRRRRRAT